ncbi:uncharacterized protein [Palaemon carinicauda]|uniref:uncharacterized protein n=1 Tax=Palaemon carinicauda TaxID=392227 RepID=UPI0035B5C6FB
MCLVTPHEYGHLLQELLEVFKPELHQSERVHISTTAPPTHCKFRRLSPQKLKEAKGTFQEMERMEICKKSSSPCASPLHMVKKPYGSWRPCGDYTGLNLVTTSDHDLLPNMQDLTGALPGALFSLKLISGSHIFRFPGFPTTSQRRPSSPHSGPTFSPTQRSA